MDIRLKFREQQRKGAPPPPPVRKPRELTSEEFLERLTDRIRSVVGSTRPLAEGETPPTASVAPKRKISFDDIGAILESIREENKEL